MTMHWRNEGINITLLSLFIPTAKGNKGDRGVMGHKGEKGSRGPQGPAIYFHSGDEILSIKGEKVGPMFFCMTF